LYRVTVNAAIDFIRGRGAKGTIQPLPEEPTDRIAETGPGIEDRLDLGTLQQA
ncbi:MAG: hypothetical protein GTO30_07845, partial [Acidobacteria bacterium]|nr:hypothetical protein [Acidobacteriota bacterium]NIQ83698.1 hypothetical protein [Acidobacteriota bacterium]